MTNLKKVIPLNSDELSQLEKARKDLKCAQNELDVIEKQITKSYLAKYNYPWSVSIDGGFILIYRYDK